MSLRSPKHKYCATITFDKFIDGIGQSVTMSNNDLRVLKSMITEFKFSGYVELRENKEEYPKFEWVKIDCYKYEP